MMIEAIHYATGEPMAITIDQGRIRSVEPSATRHKGAQLPIVAPGLVDLQINGYAGYDFNQLPLTKAEVTDVVRMLWIQGVTSFYPTVITNSPDEIHEALTVIGQACDQSSVVDRAIAGIHLEGPFISPDDGARGAHVQEHIRPPEWELFCEWQAASGGRIRIITLSPEWPNSAAFIRSCTESGVTVSIGHTSASSDQIREAVDAGARMSTHLGNGAHLMLPRHPNYIWEQLAQDQLWSCLIADSFHLPEQFLKVALKVKGPHAMLVSDAVALSGMNPGAYTTAVGGRVVLTPEGKLHLADNDELLAGSALMLTAGIQHLTSLGLTTLSEAWDMASVRPSAFMNLPTAAGLSTGAPADFILFSYGSEGTIQIEQTYKAGELVYRQE